MFGYTIVKKAHLEDLEFANSKFWTMSYQLLDLQACLDDAMTENKRLFGLLAKKQSEPKRDKNGVLRAKDGKFAKNSKKRDILLQQQAL